MFRLSLIALASALALAGCNQGLSTSSDQSAKAVDEIMATDRAFNDLAREKGEQAAFAYYMDPMMGMQLRANEEPAKGLAEIKRLHGDAGIPSALVWEPAEAFAAKSGDFGMSWGHWHWSGTENGAAATRSGKYLTVWHKMPSGEWKGLMDTGVSDRPSETQAPQPAPQGQSAPLPTPNFSPTAPPSTNPSQIAPPEVTPNTVPQHSDPHSNPNNPQ